MRFSSFPRTVLGLLAGLTLAVQVQAVPVLVESFGGSNANNLAGTTADIGGTWTGSANFKEGGQVTGTGTAYVPVSITPGSIYTLSADLLPAPGATTNWLAVGFTNGASAGGASIQSNGAGANPSAWALLRDNGQTQGFFGPGTANIGPNNTVVGNPSNLRVRLDTTNPSHYTVHFFDENTALGNWGVIPATSLTHVAISSAGMTGSIDNVVLDQTPVTTVAGVLLTDNFTVNQPVANHADINLNLINRQGGAFAPIGYRGTGNAQIGNPIPTDKTILDGANVLLLAGNATATLNRNFNNAVSQGILEIVYDAAPDVRVPGAAASTNWVAINLGTNVQETPLVDSSLTHFGLLVRENGQFQAFDGNTVVGAGVMDATPIENDFYRGIRLLLSDPGDGNAFDGIGVTKIDAYYEGVNFFSFTKTGGGYANNYINFQSNSIGYVDNLQISLLIPEPATMSLLAIGGVALLRRRRVA